MRYQLLKTSPYLGGQVRWDIPMYYHYDDGVHVVDTPELHIVPLDDNIRFNEGNSWETFNYSHLENIKHLFSEIGDAFFSSEGEWSGDYWLYNQGDILDPYSHTYIMGARRTRFNRYGKQFAFLCPLWISEETDPTKFAFEVSVKVSGEERDHIVRRVFKLSDKMCEYMSDYLNKSARYVEPDPSAPDPGYQGVNDDLLSIKFDPDYAFITGVQADAGKFSTRDISYIVHDIVDREIPMMEFDNMLVSKFRESNMIAQQLINLNFLFNMEDISYILKEKLAGKHVGISMKVLYNGEYLPIKDFYTNYTSIPVYRVDRASMSRSKNVCDYMGDNKIIDYIHTNKFTQPIFHWTMVENPSYIYNFYDGFAPVFSNGGDYQRLQGRYYDQADISQENHTVYNSAATWCKLMDGTGLTLETILSYDTIVNRDPDHYTSQLFINEKTGVAYLNNNRYDIAKLAMDKYRFSKWKPTYLYTSILDHIDVGNDAGLECALVITINDDKVILHFEHTNIYDSTYRQYRYLIQKAIDNDYNVPISQDNVGIGNKFVIRVAEHNTYKKPNELSSNDDVELIKSILSCLVDMYDVWKRPYRVDYTKGTITSPVDAFEDYHPEECNMFKNNAHNGYVLRYTGGLCPLFIDPEDENYRNVVYRYNQWGDINTSEVQEYNKMLKTGMTPDYPSLGYYNFTEERDRLEIPKWYKQWPWDVAWKNDGILYVMPESYKTHFIESTPIPFTEQQEEEKMWVLLYDYIDSIGISTDTTWMKHKLKELYKVSYNFDYPDERTIDQIKYYVRFDLR